MSSQKNNHLEISIMTTLREKMKNEMILMGLAESTQKRYLYAVCKLRDYYNVSPPNLTSDEVRDYLLYLKKRTWPPTVIMSLFMH